MKYLHDLVSEKFSALAKILNASLRFIQQLFNRIHLRQVDKIFIEYLFSKLYNKCFNPGCVYSIRIFCVTLPPMGYVFTYNTDFTLVKTMDTIANITGP